MGTILRKWKWLIISGLAVVLLAYVADPLGSFVVETLLRLQSSQEAQSNSIPHWRPFTNRECGYVIEFPSRPFEHPYELSNRQAVVSYRQIASSLATNSVFMVATLVTTVTNDLTEKQINYILDKSVLGALDADCKLLVQRNIRLGSIPGREIEFEKAGKYFFKMRCYRGKHRFQELTAMTLLSDRQSTNILHFLDSFSIISE